MQVTAVRTTGIYCRDGCPALPLKANIVPYENPVAALANGYRPCLRCRPDRGSFNLTQGATSEAVRMALVLLADGSLDGASEIELGHEVGLSARHLRRLFIAEIGATPTLVAQSRRAHFARRLLDETDIGIGELAFAAGFSSIRHMNRIMKDTFGFTPTELRSKRLKSDPIVVDGGLPLRLPKPADLDFEASLAYLGPRAIPGVEAVDERTYRRTIEVHGQPGMLEISELNDAHLLVVAHVPSYVALIDQVERVRRLFGLDQEMTAARRHLATDPLVGPVIKALPGLRLPSAFDRFETAIRIIVGQQVSVAGATTVVGRIASEFGDHVTGLENYGLDRLFPTPTQLAAASVSGMPSRRAESIRVFAAAVAARDLALTPGASLDHTLGSIEALPGIGPWTSNLIALRVMGFEDAFPASDLGLRKAATRLAGSTELITAQDLERMAEAWRLYRGLAAAAMWSTL